MALHRIICKLSGPEGPLTGSETDGGKRNRRDSLSDPVVEETEPTNVVSTPDLYISESDDDESVGQEGPGRSSHVESNSAEYLGNPGDGYQQGSTKRGRKKQLYPQQVLQSSQLGDRLPNVPKPYAPTVDNLSFQQFLPENIPFSCSLCHETHRGSYSKHLRDYHKVDYCEDNSLCPLCLNPVSLAQLSMHFSKSHGVIAQTSLNALVLLAMVSNPTNPDSIKVKKKVKAFTNKLDEVKTVAPPPMMQTNVVPMMFQNVFGSKVPVPMNELFKGHLLPSPTQTPLNSLHLPPHQQFMQGQNVTAIPSFLQALLNGDPNISPQSLIPDVRKQSIPLDKSAVPSKESVEAIVAKLTRKFSDATTEKDSFQCLLCKKWFAVPPVKHMRAHLINYREMDKLTAPLEGVPGGCHVCLTCFQIFDSQPMANFHVAKAHNNHPESDCDVVDEDNHSTSFDSQNNTPKMMLTMREGGNRNANTNNNNSSLHNGHSGMSFNDTNFADPKGVELDNAGRVKSGKVRKQCELCGQWSNIKWFFKHMSEVHKALFCRCCREYLPIQEQEEHRKWHSEPPYMGQKIRLENGQPIIIDRKERASLTPIGSLAAWGGSSGGMVVKAIDDSVVSLPRKRKSTTASLVAMDCDSPPTKISTGPYPGSVSEHSNGSKTGKDTLMPKEVCPVCGIFITYKNLARHIKLRHKIKYKFCHKCRKFVPNDTYDDHKVACVSSDSSPSHHRQEGLESMYPDGLIGDLSDGPREVADDEAGHSESGPECIDLSAGSSASFTGTTPPSSLAGDSGIDTSLLDGRKSDSFRANTSKTKLESLLGKEFKHPRRRCSICGYNVSYSNFKRHLRNAHPQQYSQCEKDNPDFGKALASLCHYVDDENQGSDVNGQLHLQDADLSTAFVRCPICDDHVLNEYLGRHIILNHPEENPREDDNDNDVSEEGKDEFCEKDDELENEQSKQKKIASCPECKIEMESDVVINHCRTKHRVSYKQCQTCEKFINKKAFGSHMLKHNQGGRIMTRSSGEDTSKQHANQDDESSDLEEIPLAPVVEIDDDEDEERLTIDIKSNSDDTSL